MATLKIKDIRKMGNEERTKRLKELKLELVKAKVNASKTGSSKAREIRRTIARILTINKSFKTEEKSSIIPKVEKQLGKKKMLKKT
ncbi:MAG: 50S ribosomal protein L29 [archaeon]